MSIEKNIIAIGGGGFGRTIKDLRIEEYILKSWSLVKMGTTSAQKKLFFNLKKEKLKV